MFCLTRRILCVTLLLEALMSNSKPPHVKFIRIRLLDPFFVEDVLKRIRQIPGIVSVAQTFPGNVNVYLQKLCIMKVEESALADVLAKLQKDADLVSAEQIPAPPKLLN